MSSPTEQPTVSELDAALADAIAAELLARQAEAGDLQAAAMHEINRIRAEIQKAGRQ